MTTRLPTPQASTDILFSVRGYVTDPKQIGYQTLTNYESTYWAPLVGNDAWRLYEILRSFCHQGNNTCHPSINLLIAILGLKDRSVLIGRAKPKTVNGKAYNYPGLIQTLQNYNLVIAEATGEGPLLRYVFHVHMTPGLLTDQELGQLPEILREKHRELLERCEAERKALEAKKKPPKLSVNGGTSAPSDHKSDASTGAEGVLEIPIPPIGNSNTPYWNFQYKQQPINNTQLTPRAREDHNNNSGETSTKSDDVVAFFESTIANDGPLPTSIPESIKEDNAQAAHFVQDALTIEPVCEPAFVSLDSNTSIPLDPSALTRTVSQPDVAAALVRLGLADTVTKRLTSRYSAERIQEKIQFLVYLQEQAPDKVKNPRGWLRRAIEENYGPPDGFLTQAERDRFAAEAVRQAQADAAYAQATQARQVAQEAQQAAFRQQLHEQYGTTEEDLTFWEKVQAEIKFVSIAHPDLKSLLTDAEILNWNGATVQIGIPQEACLRQLGHPGTRKVIQRALSQVAGKKVEPAFVLLPKAKQDGL